MCIRDSGKAPEIIFKETRPFDLPYAVVNPKKATQQLGWNPSQNIADIINSMGEKSLTLSSGGRTLDTSKV